MALFYVILNKVNLILAFTTLCEFFKLFCLYYTLTHIKYNIFELSLDEYYFQAHALDLVQSVTGPIEEKKIHKSLIYNLFLTDDCFSKDDKIKV